jgi:hypothetical protein
MIRRLAETLRQPEYTGDDRCLPCTVVNLLIATVLGVLTSRRSKPAGVLVVAGSLVLIYLRGYLVPGTPQLTKRYLPPAVLRWFGKSPEADLATGIDTSTHSTTGDRTTDEEPADEEPAEESVTVPDDLEAYLLEADILEPCEDREDLCLTSAFEAEWVEEIESAVESEIRTEATVEAFGFDADMEEFELRKQGNGAYALRFGVQDSDRASWRNAGKWPSYAALVADVAASRRLDSWLEAWDAYSPEQRGKILNSLRMFLETCPTAEGGVEMTEETVESCCLSDTTVFAVVCEETGDRLFEHEIPG